MGPGDPITAGVMEGAGEDVVRAAREAFDVLRGAGDGVDVAAGAQEVPDPGFEVPSSVTTVTELDPQEDPDGVRCGRSPDLPALLSPWDTLTS